MNSAQANKINVIDRCIGSKDFNLLHLSRLTNGAGLAPWSLPTKDFCQWESHALVPSFFGLRFCSVTVKKR